ncbi:MAG: BatD family protein, partial [Myxococcota bacterium]
MRRIGECARARALILVTGGSARAQNEHARLDVSIDREVVELGRTFTYTIHASVRGNATIRVLDEPDLRPFSLVGRTQIPQYTIRNGVTERQLTVSYRLRTRRRGEILINPPVVLVGDKRLEGKPLKVKVVAEGKAPKLAPKETDSAFIDINTLPKGRKPYVGEQITLEYDLYQDVRRSSAELSSPPTEPSLDQFWIEELMPKEKFRKAMIRDGARALQKTQLGRYALFPLRAEVATIEPMTLQLVQNTMFGAGERFAMQSNPIKLDVQPLPPGSPEGFSEGNVGDWDLLVTTETLRTQVGRPFQVRVTVKGAGQVSRVRMPRLPELDAVLVSGPDEDVRTGVRQLTITGEKSLVYTLTPKEEGLLELPPVSFSYFDPNEGRYETKQSAPIKILVNTGTMPEEFVQEAQPLAKARETNSEEDVMASLRAEARGAKRDVQLSGWRAKASCTAHPLFWLLLTFPLLGLSLLLAGPRVRHLATRETPERLHRGGAKRALAALDAATGAQPKDAYPQIQSAIKIYVTEALELPSGAVTPAELPRRLAKLGVDEQLRDTLGDALQTCNRARFARDEDDAHGAKDLAKRVRAALQDIERQRKRGKVSVHGSTSALVALLAGACAAAALASAPAGAQAGDAEAMSDTELVSKAIGRQDAREFEEAIALWREALKRSPGHPDVLYNLGTSALQSGELGVARLSLERAMLARPSDAATRKNLDVVRRMVRVSKFERVRGRATKLSTADEFATWDIARRLTSGT